MFYRSALQQFRIFLIDLDELDEALDAEIGERLNAVFANAKDPNCALLDLHFIGEVAQPIFLFAEVPRDLGDGGDVIDLADVGGHPAEPKSLVLASDSRAAGSPSRCAGCPAIRAGASVGHLRVDTVYFRRYAECA